jgi:hypothetical protein
MKLKTILFLLLVVCFTTTQAQVEKPMPTEAQWQAYFKAKQTSIQKKLFKSIQEGKIKGYKNDSFVTTYPLEDLKMRGSTERVVTLNGKDTVVYDPMQADALQDFWFCKQISSSPFNEIESNKLMAVAMTFQPIFARAKSRPQPYCWISETELKWVLSKDEYEWLLLVFYYAKNDNTLLFRDSEWGDAYWEVNHVKLLNNFYCADSTLFQKLSQSFASNSFYFEDYWYYEGYNEVASVYDHQQKKAISYADFETTYKEKLTVYIQTDANNPELGKDTVIYNPRVLFPVSNIIIDKANNRIKTFNFEKKDEGKGGKVLKFSVDADLIRKRETLPTLFWFFEDYYQWRL